MTRILWAILALGLAANTAGATDISGLKVEHANRKNKAISVSAPHPVRSGDTALAFQVKDGQCKGNRSYNDCKGSRERSEIVDRSKIRTGKEYWYAFSLFIPKSTPSIDPATTILAQFQDTKGSGEITLGFNLFKEGLELSQDNPNTQQVDDMDPPKPMVIKIVTPPSRLRGRWIDLKVQAIWSVQQDGMIRVWVDGRKVHDHRGRNLNRNVAPSFKFGVYRSGLHKLRSIGRKVPTQLVYFDHIRRGTTEAEVSLK
ncbi:polysaccharide lyase [Aliiroseovarius crassostreae]|uniref:polysaccharide lyase n=1 Tax=Aliiroseovarius crassostreae TaxID=154981 RepID=UPI003C7979C6